jgi:hypothetical protein
MNRDETAGQSVSDPRIFVIGFGRWVKRTAPLLLFSLVFTSIRLLLHCVVTPQTQTHTHTRARTRTYTRARIASLFFPSLASSLCVFFCLIMNETPCLMIPAAPISCPPSGRTVWGGFVIGKWVYAQSIDRSMQLIQMQSIKAAGGQIQPTHHHVVISTPAHAHTRTHACHAPA